MLTRGLLLFRVDSRNGKHAVVQRRGQVISNAGYVQLSRDAMNASACVSAMRLNCEVFLDTCFCYGM